MQEEEEQEEATTTTTSREATTDDLRRYLWRAVEALCSVVDVAERCEHCAPDRATQRVLATCLAATAPDSGGTRNDYLSRINSATRAYLRMLKRVRPRHYAHMAPAGRDFVPWRSLTEMHAMVTKNDMQEQQHRWDNEKVLGLLMCGLQGLAAAVRDALRLGARVDAGVDALVKLVCASQRAHVSGLRAWVLCAECGTATGTTLEAVRAAQLKRFGAPDAAAAVRWLPSARAGAATDRGPAVLVCGHSTATLRAVLDAAQGSHVRVYTHGALLTAHLHPRLRQYRALAGHYGRALSDASTSEIAEFPGPVLLTDGNNSSNNTRLVLTPKVFTSAPVGGRAARPVFNGDYSPLLHTALAFPGFGGDGTEASTLTVRDAPSLVAARGAEVAAALRAGTLRHVFVVCGTDAEAEDENDEKARFGTLVRELVACLPRDCMALVWAGDGVLASETEEGAGAVAAAESGSVGNARWGLVPGTALPRVVAMGCGAALRDVVLGVRAMQMPVSALTVVLGCADAGAVAPLLALATAGVHSVFFATTTLRDLARPTSAFARFLRAACGLQQLESVPALLTATLPEGSAAEGEEMRVSEAHVSVSAKKASLVRENVSNIEDALFAVES